MLEAEEAMTIELRAMIAEKDREISVVKNTALPFLNPVPKSIPSQEGLGTGKQPALRINTDTDQSTTEIHTSPNAPSIVVSHSDRVEVSVSRIDAKELRHVEQGFGILDKNDVYLKLQLGPNGKVLTTTTRDDAGAKASYDYVNDKNDHKLADTMKWITTVGELLTSKLSWSVWDWNDPNDKNKRPDICIGNSAEVALELKLIRDGGTELSETIMLNNQPLDGNDNKKIAGKVTIVLNVKVVKETQAAVYASPGTEGSDKAVSFYRGSGKHGMDEEAEKANVELRVRVESLQQQLSALQVILHLVNPPNQNTLSSFQLTCRKSIPLKYSPTNFQPIFMFNDTLIYSCLHQDRHMKLLMLQTGSTPSASPRNSISSPSEKGRKKNGNLSLSRDAIDELDEEEAMADAAAGGGSGGDPTSAEGGGPSIVEELTEEQQAKERQDKIINAQFEGWKNSCKRLRQVADKLEKERQQLSLANKELKILLHQALDGETKAPALANLVVKRITKGRLTTESDVLEFVAK